MTFHLPKHYAHAAQAGDEAAPVGHAGLAPREISKLDGLTRAPPILSVSHSRAGVSTKSNTADAAEVKGSL
ncbi:MAG TPA: hypothetical protein VMR33_15595 [Candidatus Baltobacteraceae bacterium]|nr:hypothetical protein [Candidatus Baltobacteraceae bacterium]